MSKEFSIVSSRFMARNASRNENLDSEENEFENAIDSARFPPSRAPLNSIPDPSQFQKENHGSDFDSGEKFESTRTQQHRAGEKAGVPHHSTPRLLGRNGKGQSEPNSAQSTPARSGARVSLGGGCTSGARVAQYIGGRGASTTSRISRGIPIVDSDFSIEVPHFGLNEDPSFWQDHNVQVLIRIRPLSTMERVAQGYGRCLKQESAHTLVWLGHPETRFTFDYLACETISQEKLFRIAGLPMVENCMSGYNSCMFAYGQTGSGKTYTMMGEISEAEGKLNQDCGITPRIFEYLFSRIRMEEENRRDEKLKFSCKCSFLEIYNEQITDLLEPSSTNLQLREDLAKGVYVENLTEYNVRTVNDVLKLLLQGAANRKIAATRMNSESSRSHSVFTCIIESHWEKDSLTHLRFARLNLVDLAGSERQKSSGAEGDRLKEAANINKSLSTLGLVIMSLVDLAHGKHRHVPYRDSRLTFLLQDSLGGNSKTMIIANVSPSLCSANETLSTLKFAQRAKLIQNNAKVNEDASGDVTALQREIKELKGQLSSLMKNQNMSRFLSARVASLEESGSCGYSRSCEISGEIKKDGHHCQLEGMLDNKMKSMEEILVGALRREKVAETALEKSEAEIEHMNHLASQREEDAQRTKMMLRFREEKIKQLEMLISGSSFAQGYLMEENKAKEEIQLLQVKIERNPEVTRFALENIRLLEQLQLYQNFYEQGEREILLAEISELRDQLLNFLEGKDKLSSKYVTEVQDNANYAMEKELEDCRNMNSGLIRELDELRTEVGKYFICNQAATDSVTDSSSKDREQFRQADKYSSVETMSIRSDSGYEMASYAQEDDVLENKNDINMNGASVSRHGDTREELMATRSLVEAMEAERVRLIKELQVMQEENDRYREMLWKKDNMERESLCKLEAYGMELVGLDLRNKGRTLETIDHIDKEVLQTKLEKLFKELEEARLLNCQYEKDHASQLSQQCDVELVREQVEVETTRTILHLQEEVTALRSELQESMCSMTQENKGLKDAINVKEDEIRALTQEWEKATLELTSFIVDGSKSLKDASNQIESIICSFPHVNTWISDYVEKAAKVCIEKEETILLLQKSLEDAQKLLAEMELKLDSLKGATMALNELRLQDNVASTEEALQLSVVVNEKNNVASNFESELKLKKDQTAVAVMKWLSDSHKDSERGDIDGNTCASNLAVPIDFECNMSYENFDENILIDSDTNGQIEMTSLGVQESESHIHASFADIQVHLAASEQDLLQMCSECNDLVHHVIKEIHKVRSEFMTLKKNTGNIQFCKVESQSEEVSRPLKFENQCQILHQIKGDLAETSGRLNSIRHSVNAKENMHILSSKDQYLSEADGTSDDYSTSSSDFSNGSIAPGTNLDGLSFACFHGRNHELTLDAKSQGGLALETHDQETEKIRECNQTMTVDLIKELDVVSIALNKANVQLNSLLNENDLGKCYNGEEEKLVVLPFGLPVERAEKGSHYSRTASSIQGVDHVRSFFNNFEEARATVKEADFMLNELVKANEKSKHLTGMWRQAGEDLLVERTSLMDELEQLKSSVSLYEGENQLVLDQVQSALLDVANSMTSLEESFLQMKGGVEEILEVLYSDVFSIGKEILHFIGNSRSSVEDMFSETMERGFSLFVIHQCHIRKFIDKLLNLSVEFDTHHFKKQEKASVIDTTQATYLSTQGNITSTNGDLNGETQSDKVRDLEDEEVGRSHTRLIYENLSLKKELDRKEVLLEGLLFDFRLLQESASNQKDIKDDRDKLIVALCQVRQELELKTSEADDLFIQQRKHENCLADMEKSLFMSNSDLEQAKQRIDMLSKKNAQFRVLVKDLHLDKAAAEEALKDQKEVVKGLEKEILCLISSAEEQLLTSVKAIEEDLTKVTEERDYLVEHIRSLNDKLEMAYALADEKESIAVEARQESEASKMYAEQKEEEVKILEHSIEELECTVNVLERRVHDMDEEVERHYMIRDSLETELQALRQRLLKVENFTDTVDRANVIAEESKYEVSRSEEIQEAYTRIQILERERVELNKDIKQYKEYISEILLHSEAQASQYQEKYKALESLVREVEIDAPNSSASATTLQKNEKTSTRTRGSSSPFRCIAGLVQQMHLEKEELATARLRVEELESLLAAKQKEVCMLNTRLAAAESMTHDVIRDLLGVKLDMTNYAHLIDQYQVQRLVEEAHRHSEEILSKEHEIINLKRHIDALVEERESCISEINRKEADMLTTQITLEQLRERDQLLSAQNEMLKTDKTNLLRRVAELDQMVKALLDSQSSDQRIQPTIKDNASLKLIDTDYSKRLDHAQKLLSRANDDLAKYRRPSSSHPSVRSQGQSSETRYRRPKT